MTPGKWTKSSFSSDSANCVEVKWTRACSAQNGCVEVAWTRADLCSDGMCVEVARDTDRWLVRDSKDPDGPVLAYTTDEFVRICHQTIVNPTRQPDCVVTVRDIHAWVGFTADGELVTRKFNRGEMAAFRAGVLAGEFRLPAVLEHQTQGAC